MKLWLKFPPNMKAGKAEILRMRGKRVCYVNPHTQSKDRSKEVTLFPDTPTEVPDSYAKLLLEQDPHIVSKTQQKDFEPAEPSVMEKRETEIRDYNRPVTFAPNANPNVSKPGHPQGFNTIDQAHAEIKAKEAPAEESKGGPKDVGKYLKYFTGAVAEDDTKLSTFKEAAEMDFGPMRTSGVTKFLKVFGFEPKNDKVSAANLKLALNGVLDIYAASLNVDSGEFQPELPPDLTAESGDPVSSGALPTVENPPAGQPVVG